jgi:sugar lactone lactonase YvrE
MACADDCPVSLAREHSETVRLGYSDRAMRRRFRTHFLLVRDVLAIGRGHFRQAAERIVMRQVARSVCVLFLPLLAIAGCQNDANSSDRSTRHSATSADPAIQAGALEVVHQFNGPMPTGVTVSQRGRIFVNYPRWEDPIQFTVAELRDGQEIPFPSQEANGDQSPDQLFSVQSVVVDPRDRLWAVDTGSVNMEAIRGREWVKLVGIDLANGKVFKTIRFPAGVITQNSYINDVRFDLCRGAEGTAYITDSSSKGDNGIIVVDLASGRSWRKLNKRAEVQAEKGFKAIKDGQPLMLRKPGQPPKPALVGSDGIAISADGGRLFFCPLAGRSLYSVSTDALANEQSTDDEVAATLRKESRDFASDGLESDAQGRIYLTDYEHTAVQVRTEPSQFQILVADPRMDWPDTISLASDGYLYFTANQLDRQKKFHDGNDLRQKPYYLFRVSVNAKPVLLK